MAEIPQSPSQILHWLLDCGMRCDFEAILQHLGVGKLHRRGPLHWFLLAAALAVVAAPVTAADWRYFGTYPSQEGKWYMSFYDPESVHKISDSILTATVRSVWTKTLDAYWKKHGNDEDLIEAGAHKMAAKDFPEYFGLPDIKKDETDLLNKSIIAIGNEFIVSKKNVPARADITWKIYCTKYIFVNMSTIVYKANGQVERVLEVPVPEVNKIGPRSEMEYLRQLTCKRTV